MGLGDVYKRQVDWYPNFQSAKRNIINGNEITVHAVPDDDTIWSIVFDDGTTTSYEKMVASKSRNKSFAKILAITFPFIVGLGLFGIRRRANRAR